jgi:DNA-binding HxlR family transcriptional regulator
MRESIDKPTPRSVGKKRAADVTPSGTKRNEATECPIAATVAVLGDRWSILVLRDLLLGLRRFDELVKSLGIATNILTDRLNKLTNEGLVARTAYQSNPLRHEYRPTEAGNAFRKVIFSMAEWGRTWRMEPSGRTPVHYVSDRTGNPVELKLIDVETGDETPIDQTTSVLTEWADELSKWRVTTGKNHNALDETDDA